MADKAVLWDVNGVIIDDMKIHYVSYREVLGEMGYDVTDEYLVTKCVGTPPTEVFADILPQIGNPVSIDEAVAIKRDNYLRLVKGNMIMPPGVRQLMEGLRSNGWKQAVASGTTRIEAEAILTELGVLEMMDAMVTCEDVSKGKPDPEPFIRAASLVGVDPANCVVIEDGEYGVRAAKKSGMKAIAVLNTQSRADLAAADLIVETLEEVDAARVLEILIKRDSLRVAT